MLRRWRVVAYDVNGVEIGELGRAWTWRGAERIARRWKTGQDDLGRLLVDIRVVAP